MAVLYMSSNPADLSLGGAWHYKFHYLSGYVCTDYQYLTIPNGTTSWYDCYVYTDPKTLIKGSWVDGAISFVKHGPTSGGLNCTLAYQARAVRVNSSGVLQEATNWSSEVQSTGNNTTTTLSIPSYNWDHLNIQDSDRFCLHWRVRCVSFDGAEPVKTYYDYFGSLSTDIVNLPFNLDHLAHHFEDLGRTWLGLTPTTFMEMHRSVDTSDIYHQTALWNRLLVPSIESAGSITLSFLKDDPTWYDAYDYEQAVTIRKSQWSDLPLRPRIKITTSNSNIEVRVRAARVNSSGVIQEQTDWGFTHTLGSVTNLSLNIPTHIWNYESIQETDRYMLNYQFRNTSVNQNASAVIQLTGVTGENWYGFYDRPANPPSLSIDPLYLHVEGGHTLKGSLDDKGDFTYPQDSFYGSFRYAEGVKYSSPFPVNRRDYSLLMLQNPPSSWGTYHHSAVTRVIITSTSRGTLYDVSDGSTGVRVKDKTSTSIKLYPGEEITVGMAWTTTASLGPSVRWGSSFIQEENAQFTKTVQSQSLSTPGTGGLYYFPAWVIPSATKGGPHLLYFDTNPGMALKQLWVISAFIGDDPYVKLNQGEWYKETDDVLLVTDLYERDVPIEVKTVYAVAPVVDIHIDETYKYSYQENSYYVYPPARADILLNIKNNSNLPLGSTNLLDVYTESDWEANKHFSNLIVEDHLKLGGS